MRFVIAGDDCCLRIGNNQIAAAIVLPVKPVFLRPFNDSFIVIGDIPSRDLQYYSICGSQLPLISLFGITESSAAEMFAAIKFKVVKGEGFFTFIQRYAIAEK